MVRSMPAANLVAATTACANGVACRTVVVVEGEAAMMLGLLWSFTAVVWLVSMYFWCRAREVFPAVVSVATAALCAWIASSYFNAT